MDTVAPATTPVVGRDVELRVLQTVLTQALGGQAQVVALSGPAGIGKSRIAQECLAASLDRGFLPLSGAAGALQQDLSYAPLVEALRPLVRQAARPGRPALVEGLPDLGRLFGELSLPPGPALGDAGLERTRLFESVCRLLERACARQPVALLLDDVHWADRGSLALLHYLIRGLASRPLLVLLTYRDDKPDAAMGELLAGLRRGGSLTELRLAGLTDQAIGLLARNLLGGEAPAGLLNVLTARSGGVPLFVGALVGSFVETGALYRYDERWALAPQQPQTVPAAVSTLLQSQVQRLPDDAREVLELLAVCGTQVEHALLERLMPTDRLLHGLTGLRVAGVVVEEVTDGRVRYRAGHPLVCEVAYDLLPMVTRLRRHTEVARTVEDYAPEQPGLLAHHVRRAGEEIDPGHAFDVLLAAADLALARKAGDEALTDVRAALELAEAVAGQDLRAGLLDRLAEAYELAGDQEQAVSAWLAAAAAHSTGVERAQRLHRAATLELEAGRGAECSRLLSEADTELAHLRPTPVHLSLALTRLHMAYRSGMSTEVDIAVAEVQRLGCPMGSPDAQMAVLVGRFHLALIAGHYINARAQASAMLDLAAELGDAAGERVRRPAVLLELGWGDLGAARSLAQEALRSARRTGVPSLEMRPRIALGLIAFFTGEWAEARQRCCEVADLAQRVGLPRGTTLAMALRGLVLLRQGRLDEASSSAAQARQALGAQSMTDRHILGVVEAVEASVMLARGDAPTAAATAAESLRRYTTLRAMTLVILTEAQIACADPQGASATIRILAATGPRAPYPGALAGWLRGRLDRDETLLRRAADDLAALGFGYEAAVARLDLAELAGGEASVLNESLRLLQHLGAQPQVDRAKRLLRRLGQRPLAPARHRRAGSLSPREEQVARLVATGLSNPEIAQRLYLSPRTVTTHLQNMYNRLELRSRTALTRYVLEELPPESRAS